MKAAFLAVALVAAMGAGAAAQTQQIHANAIIPNPLPSAPIERWSGAPGRTTVSLTTLDGATLRGWSYDGADRAMPTIVFFNRNGTTIRDNDATYRRIAAIGPSVVVYDYRGYGFSTGLPGIHFMQEDAVKIVQAATRDAGTRGVVVFGHSLGTAVAAYAAAHTPVAGVILAAPFASAEEELPIALQAAGVPSAAAAAMTPATDAIDAFGVVTFAGQFQAPLLILHGTADTEVPIAQAREVYAASVSTPKRLVELEGVDHQSVVLAPDARVAIKRFVSSLEH
ncbi:MAG TPA: alpha/beta fold hydrolase [Candidatus Elarobacter sp.]